LDVPIPLGPHYTYTANGELTSKVNGSGTTNDTYDPLADPLNVTPRLAAQIAYVVDARRSVGSASGRSDDETGTMAGGSGLGGTGDTFRSLHSAVFIVVDLELTVTPCYQVANGRH
jgi:hypothetical protein